LGALSLPKELLRKETRMTSGLITGNWVLDWLLLLALGLLILMLYAVHTLPQLMEAQRAAARALRAAAVADGIQAKAFQEAGRPSVEEVVERSDQRGMP
jgi:nucleotide-binding universal stress UspA family protein